MRNSHHLFSWAWICVFASCIFFVHGQTIEDYFRNPCTSFGTCGECIQTSPECAWCAADVYSREYSRCDKVNNLLRNCAKDKIVNPTSDFTIIYDRSFTSGGASEPPVQVKPQKVEFNLRPNEPKSFKLQFQQQANYPVDLYFLLDLSYGMYRQNEAQKRLIALGNDIPDSMANISNNFRLGFGTFVDKSLMPYTAWTDKMLENRCPISNFHCRYPHDFKNELSIGANQSSFANNMKTALANVSQSLDDAEGGLDGLIQALDCDAIGWRDVSRRIIVYSSNSLFHLAGEGKLGGATRQNKMKCNLSADGKYIGEKIYDYPSVSQVAQKLRDSKANIIFAVMENVATYYRTLETFLDGAVVGELANDSKNIVDLIKEKYYHLRSRIEFQASKSSNVDVKIKSKCKGAVMKETAVCENLEIMDSVEFDVTITVNRNICHGKEGTLKKQVFLNAVGLNDAVVVYLNVLCNCECEMPSHKNTSINDGEECTSGNGILKCGICSCNPGRFGRVCECDETQISEEKSLEFCKADRNDTLTCSGNGECICGVCECLPVSEYSRQTYTGSYCECNNYNCLRAKNKLLCGGPYRGKCNCGACNCLPGWSGNSCDCPTDKTTCLAGNGELCNGVGTCRCGRCDCNTTFSGIVGPTCEDCLNCPSQCNEYLDCAQCKGFKSGSYDPEECERNCKDYTIYKRESLSSGEGIRSCSGTGKDSCTFFFTYEYSSVNEVILTIQETKECPKKVPLASIIGGTVAAVVLIPLLLICLFIFLRNLKDRKEYSRFLSDKEKAKWDTGGNPIYRKPTTTFQNLTFQPVDDPSRTAKLGVDEQ